MTPEVNIPTIVFKACCKIQIRSCVTAFNSYPLSRSVTTCLEKQEVLHVRVSLWFVSAKQELVLHPFLCGIDLIDTTQSCVVIIETNIDQDRFHPSLLPLCI